MINVFIVVFTIMLSGMALGMPPPLPQSGWWCYAQSPAGDKSLKWGETLEEAKSSARAACNQAYGNCQVTQCYEASPYKYSCVAGKPSGITKTGGFRAFSNNAELARKAVLSSCCRYYGCNKCVSVCYENYSPYGVTNQGGVLSNGGDL